MTYPFHPTVMRRWAPGLLLALVLVLVPGPASAGVAGAAPADSSAADSPAQGKKGRRVQRYRELIDGFKGDRLASYRRYGFPAYRYYELKFSSRTEHWVYPGENLELVFAGNRLIAER